MHPCIYTYEYGSIRRIYLCGIGVAPWTVCEKLLHLVQSKPLRREYRCKVAARTNCNPQSELEPTPLYHTGAFFLLASTFDNLDILQKKLAHFFTELNTHLAQDSEKLNDDQVRARESTGTAASSHGQGKPGDLWECTLSCKTVPWPATNLPHVKWIWLPLHISPSKSHAYAQGILRNVFPG